MGRGSSGQGKQKPTNARYIENMNEAQLDIEIRRQERKINSAEREIDRLNNTSTARWARDIMEQFPGGVGGSAVTPAYRRRMEQYGNTLGKIGDQVERRNSAQQYLDRLRKAKNTIHGSGKTLDEYRKSQRAAGGTLGTKWTTANEALGVGLFGDRPQRVYKSGTFTIGKEHAYAYALMNNGRYVGSFKTLAEAKAAAAGGAEKKKRRR